MKLNVKGAGALAELFAVIAKDEKESDTRANQILSIVKARGIDTIEGWNGETRRAYAANNWKEERGRPSAESKYSGTVPRTVKQYVSRIGKAFTFGMNVSEFETMGALRTAVKLREAKIKERKTPVFYRGVIIKEPGTFTGAPLHDLGTVYAGLDEAQQRKLTKRLEAIVDEFKSTKRFRDVTVIPAYMVPRQSHASVLHH